MFKNLQQALDEKGITQKKYADLLGITQKTVYNKIHGDTEFVLSEIMKTLTLLPMYNLDYLFKQYKNDLQ